MSDPENSCPLLVFHHGVLCHLAMGLGEDPGCGGRGLSPLPENAPNLWSDTLRQWTKSVVVSSLKLEADRGKRNCSAYIAESGAKFGILKMSRHGDKKCCKICYCKNCLHMSCNQAICPA
jgi:hypothetical protein